jgi:glycosidase
VPRLDSPFVYEINTWVWLRELSLRLGRQVRLDSVPGAEWDTIANFGMDAVWLMGVWERSPEGRRIARFEQGLEPAYRQVLTDFTHQDVVGSPYSIRRYRVDDSLGGPAGLALARSELARRGLGLILDFVPNHVAPDHPWIREHPEYFIDASPDDDPAGSRCARGRDPYFPPWPDTAQLNAFHPDLRAAAIATVQSIAAQCDGVRCDMAMLLLNGVFERTWGARAGERPNSEYWSDLIDAVRAERAGFLFIAEAYWGLEPALQRLGFDYCYDKVLYDRLVHHDAASIRAHLSADIAYQQRLIRFLENHDEPRAASVFVRDREKVAAIAVATLPGAKLIFHGQLEGRRTRLPVQLGREPGESVDSDLLTFYGKLFEVAKRPSLRRGDWTLCEAHGWPDNPSNHNILAWFRRLDEERALIIMNYSPHRSQARVAVPQSSFTGARWILRDPLHEDSFERDGDEITWPGLFVDLPPWGSHVLFARSPD